MRAEAVAAPWSESRLLAPLNSLSVSPQHKGWTPPSLTSPNPGIQTGRKSFSRSSSPWRAAGQVYVDHSATFCPN